MPANKPFRLGPVALTNTLTTNIFNAGTTTGGVNCTSSPYGNLFVLFKHFHILNKTGSAATFTLYIGATGGNVAGTEFWGIATSVAANSFIDWFGLLRMDVADFLVGGASAATTLVLNGEGEIGVA